MTTEPVSTAIGFEKLPYPIRRLTALTEVDYADSYTASTTTARDKTPEEWGRALLEATPLGRQARVLWQILGLRLGPSGSPDFIQGWKIAAGDYDWIRLETKSWWATANAVCYVEDERISIALFLRYASPLAPLLWGPVSVVHQRAVPVLVHEARKRQERLAHATLDTTASPHTARPA
jgi:hypothetical protein